MTVPHSKPGPRIFQPERITGASRGIYDVLADGCWHSMTEIAGRAAPMVPAEQALRRRGHHPAAMTDLERALIVATKQRANVLNRVLIHRRGGHLERHPANPDLYRANADVAATWRAFQLTHETPVHPTEGSS